MTDLSGIQQVLGDALSGLLPDGLDQHDQRTRLLRLHTPLGGELLLAERTIIRETLVPCAQTPAGCHIDLQALSTRHDLRAADLLGQAVHLELLTASGAWRPFHGHVTRFAHLGSDGGFDRYHLHIEPWLSFLAHRTDSWVFQDMSVLDITEAVFADHQAQGALQPAWRLDIRERQALPRRSLCVQFNETDLGFLSRLWAEEGLFAWFEHAPEGHTLVLSDHTGAFQPSPQSGIRYTQAGATLREDSLHHWTGTRQVGPSLLHTASWDHRQVAPHGSTESVPDTHGQPFPLAHSDHPGAYAYEGQAQAERRARLQREAIASRRKRFEGRGTVRTLAPGLTFDLHDHAEHDADRRQSGDEAARFAVLSVTHTARNNLGFGGQHANGSDEPLYEARLQAQRASEPLRLMPFDDHGRLALSKPSVAGTQTALVVGLQDPVHTDRDGRIKVQFHWQRGEQSSHRLQHPSSSGPDNAPASDASGTWVRVAQPWAGANWGASFIPRLGQEVVVAFIEGDIDRPVVVGATYNGQGLDNAAGNQPASGAAGATGNAPAWFPGSQRQGRAEAHAHAATLSGFLSQSLESSQSGGGAHNQLVLDDTPGQGRVLLHTTQAQTWLQMGHLLQQAGNQRLLPRGHGLELHTQAQAALRAGKGLHLSTHARAGGTARRAQPLDTREAEQQLQAHGELLQTLHANAQAHLAKLPGEAAAEQLPARQALAATLRSLQAIEGEPEQPDAETTASRAGIGGGDGRIDTSLRPDLVLSAAADIASLTPANSVVATGQHITITSGTDLNLMAQRHQAWAVKDGISLFTRGDAPGPQRAVQDAGIQLHAASGNVRTEAQSGPFTLTAQKAIDLQSTTADIVITAPERIVLNGGGGYVKIEGGNIEIGTSGPAEFKAAAKELTGGGGANATQPALSKPEGLFNEAFIVKDQDTGEVMRHMRYRIEGEQGQILAQGMTNENGQTARVHTQKPEALKLFLLD